jgi:hypothetical protein
MELPNLDAGLEARLTFACADFLPELRGRGLPTGSPAAIMISAAAMGAVDLIKKLPALNKVGGPPENKVSQVRRAGGLEKLLCVHTFAS